MVFTAKLFAWAMAASVSVAQYCKPPPEDCRKIHDCTFYYGKNICLRPDGQQSCPGSKNEQCCHSGSEAAIFCW
ncbi:hypothetical protein CTRI78_v003881 [Colletotrichum trifolii]|uniref:Secreted protein n=1 Tax=Colletotrichum trifolii TaxID=5466 RepID=A0A4R8RMX9_COLTR|nr:hypothetical protein CTRI78_v003881 [Colletotrichum trifolii]